MFPTFLDSLRRAGIKASITEYLSLLGALRAGVADTSVEDFYFLARAALVKDERQLDRFDRVFAECFRGVERPPGDLRQDIPEEWLRSLSEKLLTDAEMAAIEASGGFDALMEKLRQRLAEQDSRHEGGSKWIGTGGTSPFGNGGANPEGVRIGGASRNRRAVKVWDKRAFRDLDDTLELGTRNIKLALRRLRRFARQGAATELDIDGTVRATAGRGGLLDLQMVPERHNTVKVLLFLDIGGSMDDHVRVCEELFSAARAEFKHLEHFYFHNCVYDHVWRSNRRQREQSVSLAEVMRTYGPDYKLILVGDAAMSPYEITQPGGSIEYFNEEPGLLWLQRLTAQYRRSAWINPVPLAYWPRTHSTQILRDAMQRRMYPMTLSGIDALARELSH